MVAKKTTSASKTKPQAKRAVYYEAVGRRKEATARVRLYPVEGESIELNGTKIARGDTIVNNRPVANYFPGDVYKKLYMEPFRTTNTLDRFVISIKTKGGGLSGQIGAVVLGCARALEKIDKEKYRPILKKRGFLTRDARVKERRKAGLAQSARAKKQSPKR